MSRGLSFSWGILGLLLCTACGSRTEMSYHIAGRVSNPDADGNIVYLSHSNGDELVNLDSAIVDGGAFSFHGEQEEPMMAYLRFNRSLDSLAYPVLFVLENGQMEAIMDTLVSTVKGTEQNVPFGQYQAEANRIDSLRRQLHENYLEQVAAGRMDTLQERKMYEQDCRLDAQEVELAYRYIRKNRTSPSALWLLETMQSRFDENRLQSLLSFLSSRNKNAQVLNEIASRLRNAHKIEPGNPYVDISLTEQWGRKLKLSGYMGYARYTVVGFWRSDSQPACRAMVQLGKLYRKYGYRGATFLFISLDSDVEQWSERVQSLSLPAQQCIAANPDEVESRYALAAVPAFVLINPDGSVNSRNLTIEQLGSKLQELLPYRARRDTVNRIEIDSMKK